MQHSSTYRQLPRVFQTLCILRVGSTLDITGYSAYTATAAPVPLDALLLPTLAATHSYVYK